MCSCGSPTKCGLLTRLQVWQPWSHASILGKSKTFFSSPKHSDRISAYPVFGDYFPWDKGGRCMKLTAHPYFVLRLRITGAIPSRSLIYLIACRRTCSDAKMGFWIRRQVIIAVFCVIRRNNWNHNLSRPNFHKIAVTWIFLSYGVTRLAIW